MVDDGSHLGTSEELEGVPVPLQKAFRSHELLQEEIIIIQRKVLLQFLTTTTRLASYENTKLFSKAIVKAV